MGYKKNPSAVKFDVRRSVNKNTKHCDNGKWGFKVTTLVTDIVLEVCWALPASLWPPALFWNSHHFRVWLMRGITLVRGRRWGGSCLFICTGHIRFWCWDDGFNWWFRRFSQVLSVSAVDCSVIRLNGVWLLVKPCSDLGLAPRLVAKFEWLYSNNMAFRYTG